jgi:hypothetical protein
MSKAAHYAGNNKTTHIRIGVHYTQGLFEAVVGGKSRHTKENDKT